LENEVAELHDQLAEAHEEDKKERRARRGRTQGCGCLLILFGIVLLLLIPFLGGLLLIIGLIVLVVGFCL
jgi:hypothetical protein